jgi:uncharacterized membrane protein YgaE (UPF0421/DUF939 family)
MRVRSFRFPLPPQPTPAELRLVVKMIAAGTLAWWVSTLIGQSRPLFAVLVPLVAMGGDPFAAINVSLTRTVGVFAGVLLGLGLYAVDIPSTALVALLLALSLCCGLLLRVHGSPLNTQVAITAMFMLYLGTAHRAGTVGVARIWETALGAGCAVAVSALLWPPHPLAEARRRVARLRSWLDEDLGRAAELLGTPDADAAESQLELVRERSLKAVRDVFELERGEQALRWNPRRRTDVPVFAVERQRLTGAARQYRHLRTVTRTIADIAASGLGLPSAERDRLAHAITSLRAEASDHATPAPPLDPAGLSDPRAIGLAIKLQQMVDDLAQV